MAGTVVVTETTFGSVKKCSFAWTSSAGGAADGTSTAVYDGKIIAVGTIPSGGGTAPDDNYDVAVTDGTHDLLLSAGLNRDTANTESLASDLLGAVAGSKLTLAVTSAGAAKQGTVIVWVR